MLHNVHNVHFVKPNGAANRNSATQNCCRLDNKRWKN